MKKVFLVVASAILLTLIATLSISVARKVKILSSVDEQEEADSPIDDFVEPEEQVIEDLEPVEEEELINTEDLHADEQFLEKHEKFVNTGAEFWEPPEDWEAPEEVYNTLDQSVVLLFSSMHYTESTKLLYAMYMFFGDDLSDLKWIQDVDVAQPDGVDLYWELLRDDGTAYVIWMDHYYGFIMQVPR